jgi:hypothetical protein
MGRREVAGAGDDADADPRPDGELPPPRPFVAYHYVHSSSLSALPYRKLGNIALTEINIRIFFRILWDMDRPQ